MKIYQQMHSIARISIFLLLTSPCYSATLEKVGFDDWVISNTCKKDANKLCQGYYQQPQYTAIPSAIGKSEPITITSDEASFVSKGTSIFSGNVVATQGNKTIYADKATVVHNETTGDLETITALGRVRIMEPGLRVDGTKAVAYVGTERKVIDNAVYRIYDRHARGTAKELTVDGVDKMQLSPASYTTCAPDSNAWHLKASETNFNKVTGRGEAWHAKMYVKDVPVFYWPYVNFPIDNRRQTGFLQPSYESPSNNGQTLVLPFYWNIAPNYDFTITSKYMTKRSWKFDTVTRYLTKHNDGKIKFDFLPHDRAYQELRNEKYSDPEFMTSNSPDVALRRNDLKSRDFRYSFTVDHNTYINKNLMMRLDYTDASDGDYLNDFNNNTWIYSNNQGSTIYALQRGYLQYSNSLGALKYQLEQYKTFYVANGPAGQQQLSKLPQVVFNSATYRLPQNFTWLINADYTSFIPRLVTDNNVALNYGQRFYMRPAIQYSVIEPGWFFQPRFQLNYVRYADLHITESTVLSPTNSAGINPNNPHLSLPMYDLKTGLIFERPTSFNNTSLFQTLEPTAYFLYVPVKDQNYLPNFDSEINNFDYYQVFRDNRYAGLDRVSPANQVGLGLTTKMFRASNGEELAMLGIAQIRYFTPNTVPVVETNNIDPHWSPIALIAKVRVAPQYTLTGNWIKDADSTKTASIQMQYRRDTAQILNVGYEYIRSTELNDLLGTQPSNNKLLTVSTVWSMTSQVRALGRLSYDFYQKQQVYSLAGFEYHTCCTALRFIWTKAWQYQLNREYVHGFGIQFIFKGFTGVGNLEDQSISALIPGYNANIAKT